MSDPIRVALAQMRSSTDPAENLETIATLAVDAAAAGASYLLTPEMAVAFAENREGLAAVAQPFDGNAALARCAAIARDNAIALQIGSLPIALPDGAFANRSVLFAPSGDIVALYDKIHLFDAHLPGLNQYRESATYRGGDRAVLTAAPGFRLGLTICYDLRFAALYRALAEAGAEVIAVPAAFTVPTGRAHWEILLRARAIETGCFILAAAQGGTHRNGRATYGHSMVVAPWGEILAEAPGDEPQLIVADLDLNAVAEARRRVPALDNARSFSLEKR
jgi:predicted amidohydrolase